MTYDIFSTQAPAMPRIGKGTEVIGLLLSKASKEMRQPLLPMMFPPLAAHLNRLLPTSLWKNGCHRLWSKVSATIWRPT